MHRFGDGDSDDEGDGDGDGDDGGNCGGIGDGDGDGDGDVIYRSYGSVYKARDTRDSRNVAVKIIPVENDITDLQHEIDILAQCSNPHIVEYIGCYLNQKHVWVHTIISHIHTYTHTHTHNSIDTYYAHTIHVHSHFHTHMYTLGHQMP